MKKSFFFVSPGVLSERWLQAFPDAVIVEGGLIGEHALARFDNTLCWVMTSLPDWMTLAQQLLRRGATVVAISLHESREELLTVLSAGGRGYLHALAPSNTLRAAATAVVNGGLWLGRDFVMDLIKGVQGAAQEDSLTDASPQHNALAILTAREREVCDLVASALSNKEVARKLEVTERTIKAHLSAIFEKLQVRDRVQLAVLVSSQERMSERAEKSHTPKQMGTLTMSSNGGYGF